MSRHDDLKSCQQIDRPRERMLSLGTSFITDSELLAILIRSGTIKESASDLAQRIFEDAGSLHELGKKDLAYFLQFNGIGPAKAVTICAALELGRRRQSSLLDDRKILASSNDAYLTMGPQLTDLPHEEFWITCLNRQNQLICRQQISIGGLSSTVVDPKIIFKKALMNSASSVILFHNHPSGGIMPSPQDRHITKQLVEGGKILEIAILDHLIIGNGRYYSFADEGDL